MFRARPRRRPRVRARGARDRRSSRATTRCCGCTRSPASATSRRLAGTPRPELHGRGASRSRPSSAGRSLWTSPRTLHGRAAPLGRRPRRRAGAVRRRARGAPCARAPSAPAVQPVRPRARRVRGGRPRARPRSSSARGSRPARDAEDPYGERLLLYPLALVDAWLGPRRRRRARPRGGGWSEARAPRASGRAMVRARARARPARAVGGRRAPRPRASSPPRRSCWRRWASRHPGAFPVLPDAVEALACAGDARRRPGALLERLERAGRPRSAAPGRARRRSAAAARCARRAATPEAALAPLERALARRSTGSATGRRRARALPARAARSLRAGQRTQAADALADARGRFAAMGAALWEARAVEELERAAPGPRGRRAHAGRAPHRRARRRRA